MSNDMVVYEAGGEEITLTFQDVKSLIATSDTVTDKEVLIFLKWWVGSVGKKGGVIFRRL